MTSRHIVLVEPFHGGSHEQLLRWLVPLLAQHTATTTRPPAVTLLTLPAKKWHWRLLAGSAWAAGAIPRDLGEGATIFSSSMLNLVEVLGLRPDLQCCHKVLYFHENQLEYPRRLTTPPPVKHGGGGGGSAPKIDEPPQSQRDFSLGWAQILSATAADVVAFNSLWNLRSFLDGVTRHCALIPDRAQRPTTFGALEGKCVVAYFPVPSAMPLVAAAATSSLHGRPLHIAWPHRWEWDKQPAVFFAALQWLVQKGRDFRVVVTGESFAETPAEFAAAHASLLAAGRVAHWGFVPSREAYLELLRGCDVVVSTAAHEFFGVAVVEAVACGCVPLCPAALSYPELLAPTEAELGATAAGRVLATVRGVWGAEGGGSGGVAGDGRHNRASAALPPAAGHPAAGAPAADRGSTLLYRTDSELRRRLYEYCTFPSQLRRVRAALSQSSDGGGGGAASVPPCQGADDGVGDAAVAVVATSAVDGVEVACDTGGAAAAAAVGIAAELRRLLERVHPDTLGGVFRALLLND